MFNKYYKVVEYLESLSNLHKPEYMQACLAERKSRRAEFRNEFYLKRTEELVKELKINLNQFKFIHIGGTSGKGSTVALVHSILNSAGKRVGSFYSPHPTTSIERIRAGDKYISPDDFAELMDKIKPVINRMYVQGKYGAPSYFEIFFGLALLYFKKKKCEYAVLEVGCGGEFDATNIIKKTMVCAITNIGYDHMHLLGNSLEKIAKTKAGIIKTNSIFLTTESRGKLITIFKDICRIKKCKYKNIKDIKDIKNIEDIINNLQGMQINNAKLAISAAKVIGIKDKDIIKGIKKTFLSCRFEIIQKKPTVVLDGAHNYDKLKTTFKNLNNLRFNRLFLILALNENKDVKKIIKMMANSIVETRDITGDETRDLASLQYINIYITRHLVADRTCADLKMMYNLFPSEREKWSRGRGIHFRASEETKLCLFSSALKIKKEIFVDPWQALNQALKKARQNDLILITGSFYLAGELRKKWISERNILKKL